MQQRALTAREEEILRQLTLGLSNKEIARKLNLAVGTVKTHVKSILDKLDAARRTEAVAIARLRGILREDSEHPPALGRAARAALAGVARQQREHNVMSFPSRNAA
jgi:DNA-binding CsgD family transcriptional regulator